MTIKIKIQENQNIKEFFGRRKNRVKTRDPYGGPIFPNDTQSNIRVLLDHYFKTDEMTQAQYADEIFNSIKNRLNSPSFVEKFKEKTGIEDTATPDVRAGESFLPGADTSRKYSMWFQDVIVGTFIQEMMEDTHKKLGESFVPAITLAVENEYIRKFNIPDSTPRKMNLSHWCDFASCSNTQDGDKEGEEKGEGGVEDDKGKNQDGSDIERDGQPDPSSDDIAIPIYKYSTQERYPEDHPDEKLRGKRKQPLVKILRDKGVPQVVINTVLRNITKQLKHNNIPFTESKDFVKALKVAILNEERLKGKNRDFKKKHGIDMSKLPFPEPGQTSNFSAPKSGEKMILAKNKDGEVRVYLDNQQGKDEAKQFIAGKQPDATIKPVKPGDEIPFLSTSGKEADDIRKSFGNLGDLASKGVLWPGVYEYFRQVTLARSTSGAILKMPLSQARRDRSGLATGAPKGKEVKLKEYTGDDDIENSLATSTQSAVNKATGPGGRALGVGTILNLNDNNWKKKFPWMKNVKYIALGPTTNTDSSPDPSDVKFKFFNDPKKAASWAWAGVASMKDNPERHKDFVKSSIQVSPVEIQRLYQAMFLDKFDAQTGAENPSAMAAVEGKEFWRDWADSAIDALGSLSSEESKLVVDSDTASLASAFADTETAAEEFPVDDEGKLLSGRILFADPPSDWIKYGGTAQEWTGYRVPVKSRKQSQKYRFVPGLTRKEKAAWYGLSYRVVSRALGQSRPSPSILGTKKREVIDNYTKLNGKGVKKAVGEKKNFIGMVRNRQRQMKAMDAAKKRGIEPETGTIKISPLNQQLTTISGAGLDGKDSLNLKGGRIKGTPGKGASRAQRKTALDAVSKHLAPYLKNRGIKLSESLISDVSSSIIESYLNFKLSKQNRDKNLNIFRNQIIIELKKRGLL